MADTILDTLLTRGTLDVDGTLTSSIDAPPLAPGSSDPNSDHDWFKVTLNAGETYTFGAAVTSGIYRDYLGYVAIDLRDSNGNRISKTLDDSAAPTFTYSSATGGTYFLAISAGTTNGSTSPYFDYSLSLLQGGSTPGASVVDPFVPYSTPASPTGNDVALAAQKYAGKLWAWDNCTGLVWAIGTEVGGPFYESISLATNNPSSVIPSIIPDDGYTIPISGQTYGNWQTYTKDDWQSFVKVGDIVRIPGTQLPANDYVGHSFVVEPKDLAGNWQVIDNTETAHIGGLVNSDHPVSITEHTFTNPGNTLYAQIRAAKGVLVSRLSSNSSSLPDLAIDQMPVSASTTVGGGLGIGFTIGNHSTGAAGPFDVNVYFSMNEYYDSNARFFVKVHVSSISGNSQFSWGESALLPSWINQPGTYYAIVFANQDQSMPESYYPNDSQHEAFTVSSALCFCSGTMILTPHGEIPVESLSRGSLVLNAAGIPRPISWIGSGRVLATRGSRSAATPVVVRRGALGPNLPNRNLRVTKGHSLYIDDVLVPVEFLVNHRSIHWDDRAQEVSVFHIELETHDILVANGALAESYRDDGNRWLFENANEGWSLPPKKPCAPVLTGGPVIDKIWRRLLDIAGPRPGQPITRDPDLHLLADGTSIRGTFLTPALVLFKLQKPPVSLWVITRSGVPQELGLGRDPRELGVALRAVVIRQGGQFRQIAANDERMVDGFHPFEPQNGFRWTNGRGKLPDGLLSGIVGPFDLMLKIGCTTSYSLLEQPAYHAA